jgi:phospholipid transport system substrate-binding protein
MKKIIIFFISILISLSSNAYSFEKKAEGFILKTTSDAKKIILDANENEKRKKLEELTLSSVDVVGLAKYTLGEEVKKLNDKQISLYIDTFKIFFSKNISNKLKDYSDQTVQILGSKKISDNYVLVNSKIISSKDKLEILVDWRVFLVDNKLIIRDLVVEGLSLARTQREEFASIIANKGFDALIQSQKDYIAKN